MTDEQTLPNDEPQPESQPTEELTADDLDQVVGGSAPFIPGGAVLSAASSSDDGN